MVLTLAKLGIDSCISSKRSVQPQNAPFYHSLWVLEHSSSRQLTTYQSGMHLPALAANTDGVGAPATPQRSFGPGGTLCEKR